MVASAIIEAEMVMRPAIGFLILIAVSIGSLGACTSRVPARVTYGPSLPLDKDAEIFVMANSQRERIVQSLTDAGWNCSETWTANGYLLTVSVGNRRIPRSCGSVNNVAYMLNGAGHRIMVIKGRGRTGSCEPNVFDDLSGLLSRFASRASRN